MNFFFHLFLGIILIIFSSSIVFSQETREELEKIKLQREIELLDNEILNSDKEYNIYNILLIHVLPIVGALGAAFLLAYFAWWREYKKIPTAEQEKIMNEIAKTWYSRSYLKVYNKLWEVYHPMTSVTLFYLVRRVRSVVVIPDAV